MDPERRKRRWILGGLVIAAWVCVLACVGTGLILLIQNRRAGPASTPTATPTPTPGVAAVPTDTSPQATATPTAGATPRPATQAPTGTPAHTPTATQSPTGTPAHTATATATAVTTATATATAARTALPTATPTVTPIVCDDLDDMESLTIAPGQRFSCTVTEEELTRKAKEQPDMPCREIAIRLDDGEITLVCRMGIRMSATGTVSAEDCQLSIEIVRGTIGFAQIVRGFLDTGMELIPYDAICIERAEVSDGQLQIEGYGR
jgi:hypothetical protein